MYKEEKEIRRKLEILITIYIFYIVVIRNFFELYFPDKATSIPFNYYSLVAIYIIAYGLTYLRGCYIKQFYPFDILGIINHILTTNFILLGFNIIYITNTTTIDKFPQSIIGYFIYAHIILLALLFIIPIYVMYMLLIGSFQGAIIKVESYKRPTKNKLKEIRENLNIIDKRLNRL